MSKEEDRATKKALETFPILFGERMGYDKTNLQQERRNAYIEGYHQAEKDLVAKACEYLDLHCDEVKTEDNGIAGWIDNEFIDNFRKAMEEQ